jgi:hypothetical protein
MLAHTRKRTPTNVLVAKPRNIVRTGLLETDSMVRVYASRVDMQVSSLDHDWKAYIVKKWGPDGLAATVTADKLAAYHDDKNFSHGWTTWRLGWEQFFSDIKDTWFYVRSADKYREVEQWDLELQAWRLKFEKRKVAVTMPSPSKPGPFGPSNPDVPDKGGIPWTGLMVVGGLIAGASILGSLRR